MKTFLTEKQAKVLEFIKRKISLDKQPPTIREIAAHFKFSSTGTVRDYLESLQKKGFIKIHRLKARAIELKKELLQIPILGTVPAGKPALAQEYIEGYIDLHALMGYDNSTFALRVKGNSMEQKGIMEGDVVIVHKQQVEEGDIVVALIQDEATVKVFKKHKDSYWLEPANTQYQPILCTEETKIIGKVIGVWRNYV
jgi:repressor LexA